MNEVIYTIIYSLIMSSSMIYVWNRLLNKKINYKDSKVYITIFCITIFTTFNYLFINKFIRIVLLTIIFMLFFRYLFKEDLKKCIITPIFYQILIMMSEAIFLLVIVTIFKLDLDKLKYEYLGTFVVNVSISIISILISNIYLIRKTYNIIIFDLKKTSKEILVIFSIILIGIANILAMVTYYKIDIRLLIIVNVFFTLFCFLVVLYSFKTQSNYNKVSDKYNIAIKSLNDYEEMMSKYRVANHENKNLLKTIRIMILNKDKNIPEYIDSMVEEKYEVDDKLLFKMSVIPTGGLRATIYSEILKIKGNNINYDLNIDRKIKSIDFIELDTSVILDICRVVGVFIDNAIEEAKTIKYKYIGIDLYMEDDNLNIKISNSYKNKIEVDKIFNEGYTTKGEGHGYGLSLVKKIVNNNSIFENKVEITKEIFSQILIVKIKKNHI